MDVKYSELDSDGGGGGWLWWCGRDPPPSGVIEGGGGTQWGVAETAPLLPLIS